MNVLGAVIILSPETVHSVAVILLLQIWSHSVLPVNRSQPSVPYRVSNRQLLAEVADVLDVQG